MGFFYDKEDERQRLEQQRLLAKLNRERKSAERKRSVLVEPDDEEEVLNQRSRISNGDYDDEDEEDYYVDDPEEVLVRLLKRIGSIRDQLDHIQGELSDLLQEEPELAQQYHQFVQQGGITAEDFERFRLKLLRPRPIRSRKHLRLVATSKAVKRSRPRLRGGNDDDAA
jgi:hypothetical protein